MGSWRLVPPRRPVSPVAIPCLAPSRALFPACLALPPVSASLSLPPAKPRCNHSLLPSLLLLRNPPARTRASVSPLPSDPILPHLTLPRLTPFYFASLHFTPPHLTSRRTPSHRVDTSCASWRPPPPPARNPTIVSRDSGASGTPPSHPIRWSTLVLEPAAEAFYISPNPLELDPENTHLDRIRSDSISCILATVFLWPLDSEFVLLRSLRSSVRALLPRSDTRQLTLLDSNLIGPSILLDLLDIILFEPPMGQYSVA